MNNPILDITLSETYNLYTIGFADITDYGTWNIQNPSFEITAPGFNKQVISFTPKAVNIYKSSQIGITCGQDIPCIPLPDGVYKIKYSILPNIDIFVEKSFMRVASITCQHDQLFLKIDFCEDYNSISNRELKKQLQKARLLISGSVAATNNCDFEQAYRYYRKAKEILDRIGKCENCN